jgi:hypothetical protein
MDTEEKQQLVASFFRKVREHTQEIHFFCDEMAAFRQAMRAYGETIDRRLVALKARRRRAGGQRLIALEGRGSAAPVGHGFIEIDHPRGQEDNPGKFRKRDSPFYSSSFIGRVQLLPGYQLLTRGEQRQLTLLLGANNQAISAPMRAANLEWLDKQSELPDRGMNQTTWEDQAKRLRDIIAKDWQVSPHKIKMVPGALDRFRRTLAPTEGPRDATYPRVMPKDSDVLPPFIPARQYTVGPEGARTTVYMPGKDVPVAGPLPDIHAIEDIISTLPAQLRGLLPVLVVNPQKYPRDNSAEGITDIAPRVHFLGAVNLYPHADRSIDDIRGTVIHELGHVVSVWAWGPDASAATWDGWRGAIGKDGNPPSSLGGDVEREDFAETFKLYWQVIGTDKEKDMRALMPARFKIVDDLVRKVPWEVSHQYL